MSSPGFAGNEGALECPFLIRFDHANEDVPTAEDKVVNPRAGSRWLFAFAALSELPLEPGTWSSLRYVVTQCSKGLANVGHDVQRVRKRDRGLSKRNPSWLCRCSRGSKNHTRGPL